MLLGATKAAGPISPAKAIEPLGVHLGIPDGIGDLAMTEISGEGSGIRRPGWTSLKPVACLQQMRVNVAHTDVLAARRSVLKRPWR